MNIFVRFYVKISIGVDGLLALCGVLLSNNRGACIVCGACALVHELGHICAAKAMGIRLLELRLGFAGARIYPEREGMSYKKEFFLCAWGPVFNLISAVAAVIILCFICKKNAIANDEMIVDAISFLDGSGEFGLIPALYLFISVSLLQALLNLLPVESLDGGRMMVSLISRLGNLDTAVRAQTVSTALAAVFLWTLSVYILLRTGNGIGILVSASCMFARILSGEMRRA